VFDGWRPQFPEDVAVVAVDLQQGLRADRASMELYAGTVVAEAGRMPWPLLLCGWSMGGLVAMMAAQTLRPEAVVLLEPSPPAETAGEHLEVAIPEGGTYDPEEVYGPLPAGLRTRPESSRALGQRRRGISIPWLPRRTLVVFGDEFTEERGRAIARRYGCEELHLPGLSHLDLVLNDQVPEAVARWAGWVAPI
jgi:pimeloyl-ACP methyl ester carboxylesterase